MCFNGQRRQARSSLLWWALTFASFNSIFVDSCKWRHRACWNARWNGKWFITHLSYGCSKWRTNWLLQNENNGLRNKVYLETNYRRFVDFLLRSCWEFCFILGYSRLIPRLLYLSRDEIKRWSERKPICSDVRKRKDMVRK